MASKCVSKEVIAGIEAAALECPLCMERFADPKSLPCIHSFCLLCLEKWTKERQGRLSCPICREGCQIPTGGLKKLPNNIFINGLLEYVNALEQKSEPTCACEKKARYFCRDCDQLYCRECKNAHRKIKTTKNHTMMTLKEYTSIDPVKEFALKPLNCPTHTMPFQFFCDTCKKPVCVGCTLVEHPTSGHNIIGTKDAYKTFSSLASQLVTKSCETILNFHAMNDELKKTKYVLRSNFSKCKTNITRQADELHRLIDRHKEDQLQSLKKSYRQKLRSLETKISDVELAISKLSSMRGITHNLLNCPNQVMALMSSSETTGSLQKLVESDERTGPQDVGVLKYPNSRLSPLLESNVVKQLRETESQISPIKSTVDVPHLQQLQLFPGIFGAKSITIKTANAQGKYVYILDAKVKCLAINNMTFVKQSVGADRHLKKRSKIEMIGVNIKENGVYEILTTRSSLKSCTLLCLIIDRSNAFISTVAFDEFGNVSMCENHFQPF
ncbi:E3 ubiquitin-protein ligase TRIM56-like [Anneissia japonica]|uniref:E3 ubiquitin-protein ligase TRIM56-like n=1 Tax=Anneissia japonica TaxID=1529436 RepID=UPI0014257C63|nr:E3 ubiquitin-protein ligase TRIM56-like [Anneissia japonica]